VTTTVVLAKSAFFATRAACVASKMFREQECDNAFDNALAAIQAHHFSFTSKFECAIRFRLCDRVEDAIEASPKGAFAPILLGVEIIKESTDAVAKPVLAVETSSELFPFYSITSLYPPKVPSPPQEAIPQRGADLPTDHFALVDSREIRKAWAHFSANQAGRAPSADVDADLPRRETPQQRRERLRNAPFIP
jgi:hypothetical protein